MGEQAGQQAAVTDALTLLDKHRLVLIVHEASFPGTPGLDLGHGSAGSSDGRRFLAWARGCGFDSLQLGPAGRTTQANPSPYDSTVFSRSLLPLACEALTDEHGEWAGLLRRSTFEALIGDRSTARVESDRAARAVRRALVEVHARFRSVLPLSGQAGRGRCRELPGPEAQARLVERLSEYEAFTREQGAWLQAEALASAAAARFGTVDWRRWPAAVRDAGPALAERWLATGGVGALPPALADLLSARSYAVDRARFGQFLLHRQHRQVQATARQLGLRLYGDLQIGHSLSDEWWLRPLFLTGYRMGAPPSRTNPLGQPWGYPLLDPALLGEAGQPGPVLRLLAERAGKLLDEHDGLRFDHPHGLVCPWVYRADLPDARWAVQHGARLYESPDLPDHPRLAALARVRPDQLNRSVPRHDDGWVSTLTEEQVERYALVADELLNVARARGRAAADVVFEVLSTLPLPLRRVLARVGNGRFLVTSKADPRREDDVYSCARATPADWVMIGNHDTPPLWRLLGAWADQGRGADWAAALGRRLRLPDGGASLPGQPAALARAMLAELFACPARQVAVFFADLFGMTEIYNRPGEVHPENWTLRVPADPARALRAGLAAGGALDLPGALALALRARGRELTEGRAAGLIQRLEELSAANARPLAPATVAPAGTVAPAYRPESPQATPAPKPMPQ